MDHAMLLSFRSIHVRSISCRLVHSRLGSKQLLEVYFFAENLSTVAYQVAKYGQLTTDLFPAPPKERSEG